MAGAGGIPLTPAIPMNRSADLQIGAFPIASTRRTGVRRSVPVQGNNSRAAGSSILSPKGAREWTVRAGQGADAVSQRRRHAGDCVARLLVELDREIAGRCDQ